MVAVVVVVAVVMVVVVAVVIIYVIGAFLSSICAFVSIHFVTP